MFFARWLLSDQVKYGIIDWVAWDVINNISIEAWPVPRHSSLKYARGERREARAEAHRALNGIMRLGARIMQRVCLMDRVYCRSDVALFAQLHEAS